MPGRRISPIFRAGELTPEMAEALNQLADATYSLVGGFGSGSLAVTEDRTGTRFDSTPELGGFWARISGAPGGPNGTSYPWVAQTEDVNGQTSDSPNGPTGQIAPTVRSPAVPVNGSTTVAVGSKVWLVPGQRGASYFEFDPGPAAPPVTIPARLSSGTGPSYGFFEQQETIGGIFTDKPGGQHGTCYEMAGHYDILSGPAGVGTIVWLWQLASGDFVFSYAPPPMGVRFYGNHTVSQASPVVSWVVADKDYDDGNPTPFWSSLNPTRMSAPVQGYYDCNAYASISAPSVAYCRVELLLDGGVINAFQSFSPVSSGDGVGGHIGARLKLLPGHYIEMRVVQTFGTPPNNPFGFNCALDVMYLGRVT